jgi:hypothetical protein
MTTGVLDSIQKDQQRLAAARQSVARLNGDKERIRGEMDRLETELAQARVEAQAYALVPGYEAEEGTSPEIEHLESQLEGLGSEGDRIAGEMRDLEGRLRRKVADAIPGQVSVVEQAIEALLSAYELVADGGEPVPLAYARVRERAEVFEREKAVLDQLLTMPVSHESAALHVRQEQEVWSYLRGTVRNVSMEARLGYLISDLMHWTRKGGSAFQAWFRDEFDIPPLAGSVLYDAPIPAADDLMAKLGAGYLPLI